MVGDSGDDTTLDTIGAASVGDTTLGRRHKNICTANTTSDNDLKVRGLMLLLLMFDFVLSLLAV
jgi:hypothetical protein